MKKASTQEEPRLLKEIVLPEKLVERILKRNEQIERQKERISFLQELNEEALTSFIEGQDIDVNTVLEFNQEKWVISVFEPAEKTSSDKNQK